MNKPVKLNLFKVPLSDEALRVARAIYNTYLLKGKELHLQIKIQNMFNLLKLPANKNSLSHITELLEELNEPLEVLNFTYNRNFYPRRFIFFCKYEIIHDTILIDISGEYLHAHDNYMSDTFLRE
ncbi:MAG: hypothetical protein FP820_03265 [Sulfurimonas sp.]|jgi:hypothetical protein|nr:hypothetical protein [Sulfurimonas sp.]MBU3940126.1 hypothetical protein [bacterium]MBU4025900.1 hypothetical protein [bacterium]MBU4058948.1 hypothetical protein [bacterium]MBU4111284.1 hypothetical protein [bacterium]